MNNAADPSANMLRFFSEDTPGIKLSPNAVLFVSVAYIGTVVFLHILGKIFGASTPAPTAETAPMSKVIKQSWHLFDAKSQIVGRLSQHVATVLMGKHKPTYTPNVDCGDTVVVVNVKDIKFTGRKWDQKIYRRHTGYVGNLKEVPAIEWRNRAPERVLLHAVRGMIPKTKHKLNQMARLKVYPGPEHPFQAMFPNHPVSLEQVQAQTVALTDTWDFPADFPEDIKRKVLSRVEYKVDSRLIPQLKLVTKQYE